MNVCGGASELMGLMCLAGTKMNAGCNVEWYVQVCEEARCDWSSVLLGEFMSLKFVLRTIWVRSSSSMESSHLSNVF